MSEFKGGNLLAEDNPLRNLPAESVEKLFATYAASCMSWDDGNFRVKTGEGVQDTESRIEKRIAKIIDGQAHAIRQGRLFLEMSWGEPGELSNDPFPIREASGEVLQLSGFRTVIDRVKSMGPEEMLGVLMRGYIQQARDLEEPPQTLNAALAPIFK